MVHPHSPSVDQELALYVIAAPRSGVGPARSHGGTWVSYRDGASVVICRLGPESRLLLVRPDTPAVVVHAWLDALPD